MTRTKLLFLLHFLLLSVPGFAGSIPYANVGSVASQNIVYATSNGITAYYVGSTAGYEDQIDVFDVTTGWDSGKVLDNKQTTSGTEITIGTGAGQINTGDELIFYIDTPYSRFASLAADSSDGINHAYMTAFSGGLVNGVTLPSGTFVGMEDLPFGVSDLNYNDDDFIFTGVQTTAATPEPASLFLLGTGLFGAALLTMRRCSTDAPDA